VAQDQPDFWFRKSA